MPWLAPLSWIFQTLAVFFLVGGYSAARGYRGGYLPWLRKRMIRLARPVAALVAVWIPVTVGMCLAGVPAATVHTIVFLVISPLWFLGVYAVLTALTPAAMWLVRRFGAWAAAFPAAVVAVADLVRFGLPARPGSAGSTSPAGWLVPYLLGIAWALGSLRGRRVPALMLAGRRGRHRRADRLGRVPGQHGRRERSPHLEPEPAHPGRGDASGSPSAAWPCCCATGWRG